MLSERLMAQNPNLRHEGTESIRIAASAIRQEELRRWFFEHDDMFALPHLVGDHEAGPCDSGEDTRHNRDGAAPDMLANVVTCSNLHFQNVILRVQIGHRCQQGKKVALLQIILLNSAGVAG